MITVVNSSASPDIHRVALAVETRGLTIIVKAGRFRISGVDYDLAEDQEFTVDPAVAADVVGYLVLDNGVPRVFVDEVSAQNAGLDLRRDTTLTPLHTLFIAMVSAGITSLDEMPVRVRHIVEETR